MSTLVRPALSTLLLAALTGLAGGARAELTCEQVPGAQPGAQLGCSIAISGGRVCAGANLYNAAGAITVPGEARLLAAADAAPGDELGFATALDGLLLAGGAPGKDGPAGADTGAVYVFRPGADGEWREERKLTAPDAMPQARFGSALALAGSTLAVGAPADSGRGSLAGAVYLFNTESWEIRKLVPRRLAPFDGFGTSVALDGDVLVVGAPFHDGARGNQGAAWVFQRRGSDWVESEILTAPEPVGDAEFGSAVAVSDDWVAVGARRDTGSRPGSGAVWAFHLGRGEPPQKLVAESGQAGDLFGGAVAMHGNLLAVGARSAIGGNGAVYLFERGETGSWAPGEMLPGGSGDGLGQSVALDGSHLAAGAVTAAGRAGAFSRCRQREEVLLPDLICQTRGKAQVAPGDHLVWTVTVKNQGRDAAAGVELAAPGSPDLTFLSASAPCGGGFPCQVGRIEPGASVPVRMTFAASPGATTATNTAVVHCANCEEESACAPHTTRIGCPALPPSTPPGITGRIKVEPFALPLHCGDQISYTVHLTNAGPLDLRDNPGGEIELPVPPGLVIEAAEASTGTVSVSSRLVWNTALPVCRSATLRVTARARGSAEPQTCLRGILRSDADGDGAHDTVTRLEKVCFDGCPCVSPADPWCITPP